MFGCWHSHHDDPDACSHTSAPQTTVLAGLYLLGELKYLKNFSSRSFSKLFIFL